MLNMNEYCIFHTMNLALARVYVGVCVCVSQCGALGDALCTCVALCVCVCARAGVCSRAHVCMCVTLCVRVRHYVRRCVNSVSARSGVREPVSRNNLSPV